MSLPSPSLAARQRAIDRFWESFPPVWRRITGNVHKLAEQVGVTVEQFHIMRHIRHGRTSVSDLATIQQISRSAISQTVETLVGKGLVTRRAASADRRCVALELTAAGSELLNTIFQQNRAWMAEKFNPLSEGELEEISRALELLKRIYEV